MKRPTIKRKVCEYDGRLWVIDSVRFPHLTSTSNAVYIRLEDGDDVRHVEMTQKEYLALDEILQRTEFAEKI